jgi:hypothetical protein
MLSWHSEVRKNQNESVGGGPPGLGTALRQHRAIPRGFYRGFQGSGILHSAFCLLLSVSIRVHPWFNSFCLRLCRATGFRVGPLHHSTTPAAHQYITNSLYFMIPALHPGLFEANHHKLLSMNNLRSKTTFSNQGQSGPIKPDQVIFLKYGAYHCMAQIHYHFTQDWPQLAPIRHSIPSPIMSNSSESSSRNRSVCRASPQPHCL